MLCNRAKGGFATPPFPPPPPSVHQCYTFVCSLCPSESKTHCPPEAAAIPVTSSTHTSEPSPKVWHLCKIKSTWDGGQHLESLCSNFFANHPRPNIRHSKPKGSLLNAHLEIFSMYYHLEKDPIGEWPHTNTNTHTQE